MKLNIIKILFTALTIGVLNSSAIGQPVNFGGGMVLTTERPNLGFKIQGAYGMDSILKNLKGAIGFTIFFPSTTETIKYSRADFDIDAYYSFYNISNFNFYVIGGINFTYYHTKWIDSGGTKVSEVRPGLNVGSGVNIDIGNKTKAFSEFRYVFNMYEQANICFGVLIEF